MNAAAPDPARLPCSQREDDPERSPLARQVEALQMRLERVTDEHGRLQEYGQLLHDQEETQRQLRFTVEGAGASAAASTPNANDNAPDAVSEAPVPTASALIALWPGQVVRRRGSGGGVRAFCASNRGHGPP